MSQQTHGEGGAIRCEKTAETQKNLKPAQKLCHVLQELKATKDDFEVLKRSQSKVVMSVSETVLMWSINSLCQELDKPKINTTEKKTIYVFQEPIFPNSNDTSSVNHKQSQKPIGCKASLNVGLVTQPKTKAKKKCLKKKSLLVSGSLIFKKGGVQRKNRKTKRVRFDSAAKKSDSMRKKVYKPNVRKLKSTHGGIKVNKKCQSLPNLKTNNLELLPVDEPESETSEKQVCVPKLASKSLNELPNKELPRSECDKTKTSETVKATGRTEQTKEESRNNASGKLKSENTNSNTESETDDTDDERLITELNSSKPNKTVKPKLQKHHEITSRNLNLTTENEGTETKAEKSNNEKPKNLSAAKTDNYAPKPTERNAKICKTTKEVKTERMKPKTQKSKTSISVKASDNTETKPSKSQNKMSKTTNSATLNAGEDPSSSEPLGKHTQSSTVLAADPKHFEPPTIKTQKVKIPKPDIITATKLEASKRKTSENSKTALISASAKPEQANAQVKTSIKLNPEKEKAVRDPSLNETLKKRKDKAFNSIISTKINSDESLIEVTQNPKAVRPQASEQRLDETPKIEKPSNPNANFNSGLILGESKKKTFQTSKPEKGSATKELIVKEAHKRMSKTSKCGKTNSFTKLKTDKSQGKTFEIEKTDETKLCKELLKGEPLGKLNKPAKTKKSIACPEASRVSSIHKLSHNSNSNKQIPRIGVNLGTALKESSKVLKSNKKNNDTAKHEQTLKKDSEPSSSTIIVEQTADKPLKQSEEYGKSSSTSNSKIANEGNPKLAISQKETSESLNSVEAKTPATAKIKLPTNVQVFIKDVKLTSTPQITKQQPKAMTQDDVKGTEQPKLEYSDGVSQELEDVHMLSAVTATPKISVETKDSTSVAGIKTSKTSGIKTGKGITEAHGRSKTNTPSKGDCGPTEGEAQSESCSETLSDCHDKRSDVEETQDQPETIEKISRCKSGNLTVKNKGKKNRKIAKLLFVKLTSLHYSRNKLNEYTQNLSTKPVEEIEPKESKSDSPSTNLKERQDCHQVKQKKSYKLAEEVLMLPKSTLKTGLKNGTETRSEKSNFGDSFSPSYSKSSKYAYKAPSHWEDFSIPKTQESISDQKASKLGDNETVSNQVSKKKVPDIIIEESKDENTEKLSTELTVEEELDYTDGEPAGLVIEQVLRHVYFDKVPEKSGKPLIKLSTWDEVNMLSLDKSPTNGIVLFKKGDSTPSPKKKQTHTSKGHPTTAKPPDIVKSQKTSPVLEPTQRKFGFIEALRKRLEISRKRHTVGSTTETKAEEAHQPKIHPERLALQQRSLKITHDKDETGTKDSMAQKPSDDKNRLNQTSASKESKSLKITHEKDETETKVSMTQKTPDDKSRLNQTSYAKVETSVTKSQVAQRNHPDRKSNNNSRHDPKKPFSPLSTPTGEKDIRRPEENKEQINIDKESPSSNRSSPGKRSKKKSPPKPRAENVDNCRNDEQLCSSSKEESSHSSSENSHETEKAQSEDSEQHVAIHDDSVSDHNRHAAVNAQDTKNNVKKRDQSSRKSNSKTRQEPKNSISPVRTPTREKDRSRRTQKTKEQIRKVSPNLNRSSARQHAWKKRPQARAEKVKYFSNDEQQSSSTEEGSFRPPNNFERPSRLLTSASPQFSSRKRRSPTDKKLKYKPQHRRPKTQSRSKIKQVRCLKKQGSVRSEQKRPIKRRSHSYSEQEKSTKRQRSPKSKQQRPPKKRSRSTSNMKKYLDFRSCSTSIEPKKSRRSKERSKKTKPSRNKPEIDSKTNKQKNRDSNSDVNTDPYNLEIVCFQSDKEKERDVSPSIMGEESEIDFFDMVTKIKETEPTRRGKVLPRPEMMEYHQERRAKRKQNLTNRLSNKRARPRKEHWPIRPKKRKKHWPARPGELNHEFQRVEKPRFRARKVFKHNFGDPYPKGVSRLDSGRSSYNARRHERADNYLQPRWRRR